MTLSGGADRSEQLRQALLQGLVPFNIPLTIAQSLTGFDDVVKAGLELVRAQLTRGIPQSQRLEPLSTAAAKLLVEAGVVATFDEGVVVFHERISRDKPALRRVLRASDVRAGRLPRLRATRAQRVTRLALKAGLVNRGKDGRIKSFDKRAKAAIKKAKRAQQVARDKKKRDRQGTALAKLKGIGGS